MRSHEFLRLAALIALAVWAGGLVTAGTAVAPAIFASFDAGPSGRDDAARLFGAIFNRFQFVAWIAGGVAMASLGLRAALGPRPSRLALRVWLLVAMMAASLGTRLWISPAIDDIRRETPGTVAALPASDPVRVTFGRLHGASTGLMLLSVVAGFWLLWAETKDRE